MFNSSHHYENKEFETNKHFRADHYRIYYYFNKLLLFQDNNNKTILSKIGSCRLLKLRIQNNDIQINLCNQMYIYVHIYIY